ncbi:MAG: hypothetical protein DMF60_05745 [Acidobacteria bacterium]|nr:MAG: hypothetical protein DMF60_05745 [Acidobacteriota bacterium]
MRSSLTAGETRINDHKQQTRQVRVFVESHVLETVLRVSVDPLFAERYDVAKCSDLLKVGP